MPNEVFTIGHTRRDFVEYDHPEGAYTIRAHVVTNKTVGDVLTSDGGSRTVSAGDVLVETDRPGVYTVYNGAHFDELSLEPVREQKDLGEDENGEEEEALFDPSEHKADEVRRYLRKPGLSVTERNRVILAERDGFNRASAIPSGMDVVTDGDE